MTRQDGLSFRTSNHSPEKECVSYRKVPAPAFSCFRIVSSIAGNKHLKIPVSRSHYTWQKINAYTSKSYLPFLSNKWAIFLPTSDKKKYKLFEIIQQVEVDSKYNTTTKATTIIGEAAIKLIRSLNFRKC